MDTVDTLVKARGREPLASRQLQRAADQLADAIQHARKRRSLSHGLSALDMSPSSSESEGDDEELLAFDEENQENEPSRSNTRMLMEEKAGRRKEWSFESVGGQSASASTGETTQPLFRDDTVEREARTALVRLQQEVEAQARVNKGVREELQAVLQDISAVVSVITGADVDTSLTSHEEWTREAISRRTRQWRDTLELWQDEAIMEADQTRREREEWFKAELERREEVEEELRNELLAKNEEIKRLEDKLEKAQQEAAWVADRQKAQGEASQQRLEGLEMHTEDLRTQLVDRNEVQDDDSGPSAEQQQRHVLNLLAQIKQIELRELQWELAYDHQVQLTQRLTEQLSMAEEDFRSQLIERPPSRRESVVSTLPSDQFSQYQQKIELLEESLRDTKQQIECDHEQFLYEQQKWEFEKKHMNHDAEEVHTVSVKVLKLLLIREKLLKRQERRLHGQEEQFHRDQDTLKKILNDILQECAVALLYLQQLAMVPPTHRVSSGQTETLPIKPVKLMRLLKRLKKMQQRLDAETSEAGASARARAYSPTASSTTTTTTSLTTGTYAAHRGVMP
ncbi:hypothetical protein Poli38472_000194 [Pythium oligandrum]|uniref:Uncharacterized protein n=1 Tax=Pythium oligandrum TaxID=41045 RepID=A0A8K1FHV5_PYTOL|nr:hypothetical protein Poli38472_000194 [Pythium oligandrum]|eukprot:TMW60152.1 hypothetical protein Poli38472_000194 [Pythium oligandrum]